MGGFYTYGEIGRTKAAGGFHNQTLVTLRSGEGALLVLASAVGNPLGLLHRRPRRPAQRAQPGGRIGACGGECAVGHDDLVGRLAGDEFIEITQAASVNAVAALRRRIIEAIERELIQPRTTALQP